MKIIEKLAAKKADIYENPAVTIAFLGDSVTQGCFDCYALSPTAIQTYFDAENAYHTKVRKILSMLYPEAVVNIINAGLSGGSATNGVKRLERDVLRYCPDLCVVCFGLNDCGSSDVETYSNAMGEIFDRLQEKGIEVILLTPNMMCTEVSCHLENKLLREVAETVSKNQNEGKLETFLEAAKAVAASKNIPVCDCYAKWKALNEGGVNTTDLLSNHINHPTKDMNWLFAYSLVETMFLA
ncbi:MAG: GDSL family lipase [Ruminococcaceae bacterium]|nr:GDSL family lipase [Oscillospiraceae bacterium]